MSSNNEVIDFAAAKEALKKAERVAARDRALASAIEAEWEKALLVDEKGKFDPNSGANVTMVLTHHDAWGGAFVYDVFAGKLVIARDCPAGRAGEEWSDLHDKLTADWLETSKYRLRASKGTVFDAVNAVARLHEVHPVREYLAGLEWDGRLRVNAFSAKYLRARARKGDKGQMLYLTQVSAILFLGAVARVTRPGCLLKTVVILEGAQDIGKSRAIRALCPREEWFSDSEIAYGHKDAYQGLRGKWLIELAEVDKDLRGRTSASVIKAFISSPSDYYRESYGRRFTDNPRQGAFIGSTNMSEYLTDETGGSRFLPFACGRPDVDAIVRDRDQLWAEAYARYQAGEAWWATATQETARREQRDRYAGDVWTEKVHKFVNGELEKAEKVGKRAEITTEAILTGALFVVTKDQGTAEQMRVSKVMTSLGWEHVRRSLDGRRVRLWERCPT